MINLIDYIVEKLTINKNTEVSFDHKPVKKIWLPEPDLRDEQKMNEYHSKGSKPERLVASIKDKEKLLRRLKYSIRKHWSNYVSVFAQAAVDRGYFSREEIDQYLSGVNDE